MNITVVGSYRPGEDKKSPTPRLLGSAEQFKEACRAIGLMLAQAGHRLVVPHAQSRETAEYHALAGFRDDGSSNRFYSCTEHQGDPPLKAHFEAVERSDAVILIGGFNGTYAAGLGALRRRKLIVPIPLLGGSAKDLLEIQEIDQIAVDNIRNLTLKERSWKQILVHELKLLLNEFPRVLIIHGRGDSGDELKERIAQEGQPLTSSLASSMRRGLRPNPKGNETRDLAGIASPVIMNLTGKGAESVPNVFEGLASKVSAAIAIVTADDVGGFARRTDSDQERSALQLRLSPRARENVWVEVGWFWGRLGRERVFLWLKDDVEVPSDLQGAARTEFDDLNAAWPSIRSFLLRLRTGTQASQVA